MHVFGEKTKINLDFGRFCIIFVLEFEVVVSGIGTTMCDCWRIMGELLAGYWQVNGIPRKLMVNYTVIICFFNFRVIDGVQNRTS